EVTKTTLEAHGYQVLTAGDGTEALALYAKRNNAIKVVLTDLMMPYMDGAATVRALEKMNPQVKIILSSGMPANTGAGLRGKPFIPKPYTAEKLLATLHDVLHPKRIK
ncbi:MAG: response regulator, partial [Pseudomonas sp.]